MRHNLYRKILADDQSTAKRREHDLFVEAIKAMRASDEAANDGLRRIQAVHLVNRLWTALLTDLSDPDNRLPDELRASLISIGISVMKQLARIRNRERDNFGSLIEIHSVIAEGLRQ